MCKQKMFYLFVSLIVVLCFATSSFAQQKVIKLGASLPMTGSLAREGTWLKMGFDFMKDYINEKGGVKIGNESYKLEIVYYDDKSDGVTSTKLTEKLIAEDGVKFILGPYGSGIIMATSTITEKYRIPMVVGGGVAQSIYERGFKYVFSAINTSALYFREVFQMASKLTPKVKSYAVIHQNELFPTSTAKSAQKWGQEVKIPEVYWASYSTGTKDMSSMLLEMKKTNPDLLIFTGYLNETMLAVKQMKEMNITIPLTLVNMGPTMEDWRKTMGKDANYIAGDVMWVATAPYKDPYFGSNENYVKLVREKLKVEPDYNLTAHAQAVQLFAMAIEKAQSTDPQKVRDALASLDVETFNGHIKYAEDGTSLGRPYFVQQVQKEKLVTVFPEKHANAKLAYPAPKWSERK